MAEKHEKPSNEDKQKRIADALRANLRRRKKQDHIPPVKKKG